MVTEARQHPSLTIMPIFRILESLIIFDSIDRDVRRSHYNKFVRRDISNVENWLLKCILFFNNFFLRYCIIDSQFELYWFVLIFWLIFTVVTITHGNVMIKSTNWDYWLFVLKDNILVCPLIKIEDPSRVQLFIKYFKWISWVNNIRFISWLNSYYFWL